MRSALGGEKLATLSPAGDPRSGRIARSSRRGVSVICDLPEPRIVRHAAVPLVELGLRYSTTPHQADASRPTFPAFSCARRTRSDPEAARSLPRYVEARLANALDIAVIATANITPYPACYRPYPQILVIAWSWIRNLQGPGRTYQPFTRTGRQRQESAASSLRLVWRPEVRSPHRSRVEKDHQCDAVGSVHSPFALARSQR